MSLPYPRRSVAAALQAAAYARAVDDAQLQALCHGAFDDVPEDVPMPYATLGEAIETPADTHDCYGADVTVVWHVWSQQRGMLEANQIGGRLTELFDRYRLPVDGHTVVLARHLQSTPMRDPNPRIRHVVVRFRYLTEQQPGVSS